MNISKNFVNNKFNKTNSLTDYDMYQNIRYISVNIPSTTGCTAHIKIVITCLEVNKQQCFVIIWLRKKNKENV